MSHCAATRQKQGRAGEEQEISETTVNTARGDKLRVLVVDDDKEIREILADMLAIDGHSATVCPDGSAALKAINEGPFDMLITDLGMPGMSGLDLAGAVHEAYPRMPIAIITGWSVELSEQEVFSKGVRVVMSKPFRLNEIKALVQELAVS